MKNVAAYRAWLETDTRKDFLEPFVDLTRYYIFTDNKNTYTIDDLCCGVKEKYGINIPVMPMKKIVGKIIAKDVLEIIPDKYRVKNRIGIEDDYRKFKEENNKIITAYDDVTKACFDYIKDKFDDETKYDDLIKEFNRFIRELVPEYDIKVQNNRTNTRNWNYQISRFIDEKCKSNKYETIIKKLMVGELLSSIIGITQTYKIEQFRKTKIIIDTPIVLRILGISTDGMQEVYKDIVDKATSLGAEVCVFEHTVEETRKILDGAKEWLDNPYYDASLASDALNYYRNEGKKKEDISYDTLFLARNIEELNINIIPVDVIGKFNESIGEIKKKISDVYNNFNGYKEREETIEIDAESINNIFLLRKRCGSQDIFSCKAVFVTNNVSLAVAAGRYYKEKYHTKEFPHVITDVYLGTLLWMNDTIELEKMSWERLTAQTYAALQPSSEFWREYTRIIDDLKSRGELTDEVAFMLRSNSIVSDDLMKMTDGEIRNITIETPDKIMKRLKEQGKKEGMKEVTEKFEKEMSAAEERHKCEMEMMKQRSLITKKKEKEKAILRQRNKDSVRLKLKIYYYGFMIFVFSSLCLTGWMMYSNFMSGEELWKNVISFIIELVVFSMCLLLKKQKRYRSITERKLIKSFLEVTSMDKKIHLHTCFIRWIIRNEYQKNRVHEQINNEI